MNEYRVLVRAPLSKSVLKDLRQNFKEVIYNPWNVTGERYYEDKLVEVLQDIQPDILITELDQVSSKVIQAYPKLILIGDCRANPDNIDISACTMKGIPVLCTPARNAQAVAEMIVGVLLAYNRHICESVQWVKDSQWVKGTTPYHVWMGNEIYKKTVGFVGFGAVGKATAKLFSAFDCHIQYYDPYVTDSMFSRVSLETIFSTSDIVSIHLPVLDSTQNMIDKSLFRLMKEDAIFINTARSAVVNQSDLLDLARNQTIRGILLDVLPEEPPSESSLEINQYSNVFLTPHICGSSYEVIDHQSDIISNKLFKWLSQEDLSEIVFNKEVV